MSLNATRPQAKEESTLSCRDSCLPALATDLARIQRFVAAIPRVPGRAHVPALVLASRALLILGRDREARLHLDRALEIGGLPALVLGTLALPREGPILGLLRLARPATPEVHAAAHLDLAVVALRGALQEQAQDHISAAHRLAPDMPEPQHWQRLLDMHGQSLLTWLSGGSPRFSSVAIQRLLALWPDATNGYLAPIRLRWDRASCLRLPRHGKGCVMKRYPPPLFPPSSSSLPAPSWPEKRKPLPVGSSAC